MSGTTVMQWDLCVHKCEEACVCVCVEVGEKEGMGEVWLKSLLPQWSPTHAWVKFGIELLMGLMDQKERERQQKTSKASAPI